MTLKIQESLVWDKHTGYLIGFVDLGDTELNYASLKKSEEFASHILVFLVRSVVNPLSNYSLCFGKQLVFWKKIANLKLLVLRVMVHPLTEECFGCI